MCETLVSVRPEPVLRGILDAELPFLLTIPSVLALCNQSVVN